MDRMNFFRFWSLSIFGIGLAISEISFPEVVIKFKPSCEASCVDEFSQFHGLAARVALGEGFFRFRKMRQQKNIDEPSGGLTFRPISMEEVKELELSSSSSSPKCVVEKVLPQIPHFRHKRGAGDGATYNDPKWRRMWYLNDDIENVTMNVERVWRRGYTGANVVVAVVDDGLESDHPELIHNFDADASWDFIDNDDDPYPRYNLMDDNRHGTRSAGIVAAAQNNSFCGVGVAHGVGIGGIRMLDANVTDALEAASLSFKRDYVDIYSLAWGPGDYGDDVEGPGPLAEGALLHGVNHGRGGRGSVFVWASGNGGQRSDTCACDGYVNSPFTVAISAATKRGRIPWYAEPCSAIMAVTYSSSVFAFDDSIVCPDIRGRCGSHTGSSAAAPIAAGIFALVLEANSSLTWRDLQHLIVETSRSDALRDPKDEWQTNGAGKRFSNWFGFGLLDADSLVTAALSWESVSESHVEKWVTKLTSNNTFDENEPYEVVINVNSGKITRCEHVIAEITLTTEIRGDNEIKLKSPSGSSSVLLFRRPHDRSNEGFQRWSLLSVHFWGENPRGNWILQIKTSRSKSSLRAFTLAIHGTEVALPSVTTPTPISEETSPDVNASATTTKASTPTNVSGPAACALLDQMLHNFAAKDSNVTAISFGLTGLRHLVRMSLDCHREIRCKLKIMKRGNKGWRLQLEAMAAEAAERKRAIDAMAAANSKRLKTLEAVAMVIGIQSGGD